MLSLRAIQMTDELAATFAPVGEKIDTSGGMVDQLERIADPRHAVFEVLRDGEIVGRAVIAARTFASGITEASIEAAQGAAPGVDLTADALPLIERALAVDVFTIETKRPGLVRKLQRQGYSVDAYVMRKRRGH